MMNLNDQFRIKLTTEGMAVFARHYQGIDYHGVERPTIPEDGSITDSLWSLMQIFGPEIHMGGPKYE